MTESSTGTTSTVTPRHNLMSRLYTGTGAFEIVGRRRMFYIVTAVIMLLALLSIAAGSALLLTGRKRRNQVRVATH